MIRSISHSEAQALLDCGASWDFRYGGRLAGSCLAPLTVAPRLREGRAWGRAVAALHEASDRIDGAFLAHQALTDALDEDAEDQREKDTYDQDAHHMMAAHLREVLDHYRTTTSPMAIDRLEHEIEVPIPSRGGRRRSNRYRLLVRFDGMMVDEHGPWIVEYKLRGQLSELSQVTLSRQIRWYAWAWREATGTEPVGVIVDERLNEAPRPPKVNKDGRPSTDKRQVTTPELYRAACEKAGCEPDPETLEHFASRRWQARHRVLLRTREIDEAGEQLVSVARQVSLMETGDLYPVRNPAPQRCGGCAFSGICADPGDAPVVSALYTRRPPKRDRNLEEIAA